ncbi:sortase [uncultured Corynebacterium sp.]|uniref:sortase n=1 Tax=uncultured Corynebacterium sp. TaxID=159447 RepID=UPI00288B3BB4|nr:sortase [uncultured Corynebacterium sp.]
MAAVQQRRARRDAEAAQHRRPEPQLGSTWQETSSRDGKKKPMWLKFGAAALALVLVFALWPSGGFSPPEDLENNEVVAEQSPPIDPSPVIEMYVPALKMHATFEDGPCRVKDGAINPDTMDKACTYTSEDKPYSLPGTNAKDIVVITGHTGAGVPAVFNDLYDGSKDKHKVNIGDKLYLRTQASGDTWLVYSATDLHDPEKEGLSQSPEIWGEGPMPGRLLTISCIQPANLLAPAVRNAVVGWQFQGTSTTVDKGAEEQAPQEAE